MNIWLVVRSVDLVNPFHPCRTAQLPLVGNNIVAEDDNHAEQQQKIGEETIK